MADEFGAARDRSLPSQIGRYRIIARIGRGAMGVVYSAVDDVTGRQVALKVLMADLESDPETRVRFQREAQAAARLLHPNIITVHDAGDDRGRSFIAMQLLQGAPFPAYLKRPEAAPLERRLDLMVQICEGLAAAHAHGIIHRDLKPNNLFVETDGLLKILDFGVARFADSSMTATGTMLGTPDYMSPEQARGTQVDARSDIFSAGAVFYFMLAGHKPFPGPDLPAILYQLQHHEVPPVPGIPPELSAIVLQAMAKDPDSRPSRVEQLLAALIRFRRQYQAETRRLISKVRTRFEELEDLVRSLEEVGAALGLSDVTPAQTLYRLREVFPSFGNRAMVVDSLEQTAAARVLEEVEAECSRLAALLEERRGHVASLHRGEPLVHGLVERTLDALSREAFDDAESALREAETLQPQAPEVAAARQRLVAARAAADAAAALRQRSAEQIRRARAVFRRGRYDDAIGELRAFVEAEPGAHEAAVEMDRLIAFHTAMTASAAARRDGVRERLSAASAAANDGRLEDAIVAARQALARDPASLDASQLLDVLLRRQLEDRIALERVHARERRAAECPPLLAAARDALERGYVAIALETALAARRIAPDHPEIELLVEKAQKELHSDDAQTFNLESLPWADASPEAAPSDRDRDDGGVFG